MRDEVISTSRTLLNEELRNLYSSPSIIRMIKSRRGREYSTNGGEYGRHKPGKARKEEATRKIKT
jgi:hypothetical protein